MNHSMKRERRRDSRVMICGVRVEWSPHFGLHTWMGQQILADSDRQMQRQAKEKSPRSHASSHATVLISVMPRPSFTCWVMSMSGRTNTVGTGCIVDVVVP